MEKKIKTIFSVIFITLLSFTLFSCSDDDDDKVEAPVLTTATIHGTWQLTSWNGQAVSDGLYCYITFNRSDTSFKMYQKFDSMYARCITGSFGIEKDYYLGYVISGKYDFDMGEWNHEYIVDYEGDIMTWTAKDDDSDQCVYERCDEVPEDIVNEARDAFSTRSDDALFVPFL